MKSWRILPQTVTKCHTGSTFPYKNKIIVVAVISYEKICTVWHPPMMIGPDSAMIFAFGWTTVLAPMVMSPKRKK
jgi:hypothetical protein